MGRQLQESHALDPQIVMCMPLLRELDGKEKMSKSLNNIIGLTDVPSDMFGKTMSMPDELIAEYLDLAADFGPQEKQGLKDKLAAGENPMNIKKAIARNIIRQYHDEESAKAAEQYFANQFRNNAFEDKAFEPVAIGPIGFASERIPLIELCHRLKSGETRSSIRRMIAGGAIQVDTVRASDPISS